MSDESLHELRHTIIRLARRMRAERPDATITDAQSSVIFALANDGPQTLRSLSERERVTPPSMNRTVNGLLAAKLVTRETSQLDRRKVTIALSARGRDLVAETRRKRQAWFDVRVSTLSPAERAVLDEAAPILRELADS